MPNIDVIDVENKKLKNINLKDEIFSAEVNNTLIYSAVKWQRAKARSGNACTKTRAEVNHSTKKPFKQKGTGRARQGMTSSPVHVGGGIAFGPKPRDYNYKMNRKMKVGALRSALSQKFKEGKIKIVDSLDLQEIKTKKVKSILDSLKIQNVLLVDETNNNLARSVRNLRSAKYLNVVGLNVYDLLKYEYIVITEKSLKNFDRLVKNNSVKQGA
jgi:large subunit ribosomal protein L4